MNRELMLDSVTKTYAAGIELIKKKNADYASGSDPFQNFRNSELIGVGVERAILVRLMDKITRIGNLLDKPADVSEEKMEDTILDAINYLGLLKAYRELKTYGPGHKITTSILPGFPKQSTNQSGASALRSFHAPAAHGTEARPD